MNVLRQQRGVGLFRAFDAAEKRADVVLERERRGGVRVPSRQPAGGAPPSAAVRILAGDRAVRIDRRLERGIRPSRLAETLLKNQRKRSGFSPARFLESLYAAAQGMGELDSAEPLALLAHKVVVIHRGAEVHFGEGDAGAVYVSAVAVGGNRVPNLWL